ncbi:MAG: PadR family transcriptional regulator [Anaerolineae bacterium]|nr:PadR family transcriptional regulator [Anaerolineae bacterium]
MSPLKYILLGSLNYVPLTGYQLKKFMDESTSHFWYAQTSQIYRTLNELERTGLLTSEIEEQDDRPDRRRYHITQAGRDALREWLLRPMTVLETTKDTLLVKLFFSGQIDKDTLLTQLRLQRSLRQQHLTELQTVTRDLIAGTVGRIPERERDVILWEAARRQGELSEEAYIRWLDETIQLIQDAL